MEIRISVESISAIKVTTLGLKCIENVYGKCAVTCLCYSKNRIVKLRSLNSSTNYKIVIYKLNDYIYKSYRNKIVSLYRKFE